MQKPEGYTGPEIEVILKESKCENLQEIVDDLLKKNITGSKIGMFLKNDQEDGDLTKTVIERIGANNFERVEMQDFMNKVNKIKIAPEITNIRTASAFTEWTFEKVVKELEDSIEQERPMKHKRMANKGEALLDNEEKLKPFMSKHGITDS